MRVFVFSSENHLIIHEVVGPFLGHIFFFTISNNLLFYVND